MQEKKRFTRIRLEQISPAPQNGFYVTCADTKAYCILLGALFAFFSALLLFGRHGEKA